MRQEAQGGQAIKGNCQNSSSATVGSCATIVYEFNVEIATETLRHLTDDSHADSPATDIRQSIRSAHVAAKYKFEEVRVVPCLDVFRAGKLLKFCNIKTPTVIGDGHLQLPIGLLDFDAHATGSGLTQTV
jgi:hypothetical protein